MLVGQLIEDLKKLDTKKENQVLVYNINGTTYYIERYFRDAFYTVFTYRKHRTDSKFLWKDAKMFRGKQATAEYFVNEVIK